MTNELIEFVKGENGQLIGAVVAVKRPDTDVGIGWSLCKMTPNKNGNVDRFDKGKALLIARGRANTIRNKRAALPFSVRISYKRMVDRAFKYFKHAKNFWCEGVATTNPNLNHSTNFN